MRLFAYGTLLIPGRLAGLARAPAAAAVLDGYRRVALRGGRWPGLRRAWRGQVAGRVLCLDAALARRVRAYEGPGWVLIRVVVRIGRRDTAVFAWVAPGATSRPWPSGDPDAATAARPAGHARG